MKEIFTKIYRENVWGSKETISGTGSELNATIPLRQYMPELFKKYNIRSLLDIGCGDCNWMSKMIFELDYYLGVDVVDEIITENNRRFNSAGVKFRQGDICEMDLDFSMFDAVIMADVLAHLSFTDITLALENISNIKYAFITNYPDLKTNRDIITGDWRAVNLLIEPFNLKNPIMTIDYNDAYDIKLRQSDDKTLSLWNGF